MRRCATLAGLILVATACTSVSTTTTQDGTENSLQTTSSAPTSGTPSSTQEPVSTTPATGSATTAVGTHGYVQGCHESILADSSIEELDRDYLASSIVVGPALLGTARMLGEFNGGPGGWGPDAEGRHPAIKIPLTLEQGATATLSIFPQHQDRISLIYGHGPSRDTGRYTIEEGLTETTFEACETGDTFFNGGFIVGSPGCYPVGVSAAGREDLGTVLRVGVDSCPTPTSQEPAPPVSDVCSFATVWATIQNFLGAYNSGEPDLTDRFFADPDRFQWYSEPPDRLDDDAFDHSTLDSYLVTRHEQGDHLEPTEFHYNGYRQSDRTGHFGFTLLRLPEVEVNGKGAIDCVTGRIMVWSLGLDPVPNEN